MSKSIGRSGLEPLSIEQLETGLCAMMDGKTDRGVFWDDNVAAFRQTVIFAIRETSDLLLSPTIPQRWRFELEAQLEDLIQYIALADRYIERRDFLPASRRPH
jgi:hypothetical protein